GEFWEFEDSLKLLDSDSFDAALTNQLLAGKIGLDEAEKRMRGFAQRFIDVHVERRVERDRKNRLTPAPPKVERKQLLGKGYSTRGEIRDALIKFYNRGGTPAGAWRPGDLFVYGCDKSFAYKIARKMR